MGVAHGHLLWTDRRDTSRWQSRGVALLVTATLFTAAFASMTRLGRPVDDSRFADAYPRIVFFPPTPRAELPPKTIDRPRVLAPPATAPVRTREQPVAAPVPVVVPASPPAADVKRDSSAVRRTPGDEVSPLTRLVPMRDVPTFTPSATPSTAARGAPLAASGVTVRSTPLTTAQRDSIVTSKIASALAADRDELAHRGRIGSANGQQPGTLSAGVSIPFPLFSPGPSAAERKRNAVIDADNQLRLRRLQDRELAKADSIRADSLRRDSLALARRAIRP